MVEILQRNENFYTTKESVLVELMKEGHDFLELFDIDAVLKRETISLLYQFFKRCENFPHNAFKFFIAGYYIIERHPKAFPVHDSKEEFCRRFGIKVSALDYSVRRIEDVLHLTRILDDKNYPYYFDPRRDICFLLVKQIAVRKVDAAMMDFLVKSELVNSHALAEELVNEVIFERKLYPEELFRQFFEIFQDIIVHLLGRYEEYNEYIKLQERYFI